MPQNRTGYYYPSLSDKELLRVALEWVRTEKDKNDTYALVQELTNRLEERVTEEY